MLYDSNLDLNISFHRKVAKANLISEIYQRLPNLIGYVFFGPSLVLLLFTIVVVAVS